MPTEGKRPAKDYLIEFNKRPMEERRASAAAGGRAAALVKRRRRAMREAAKLLMNMPLPEGMDPLDKIQFALDHLGIESRDQNNQMAILVAQLLKALKGDTESAKFLRDTGGDKPTDNVQQTGSMKINISGEIEEWSK